MNIFNYFAELSEKKISYTVKSGRYAAQSKRERNIPPYLKNIMMLNSKDKFIEIGSGLGNLLIPLSKYVGKTTALDHPTIIKNLKKRVGKKKNFSFISGNFLKKKINFKYDKILVYGVLHCLKNSKEVNNFIYKGIKILKNGGIIFFGDIPNESLKQKFLNSRKGKIFQKKWKRSVSKQKFEAKNFGSLVKFNNKTIFNIIRKFENKRTEVYVIPQPNDHPFSNTRVDLIIKKYN